MVSEVCRPTLGARRFAAGLACFAAASLLALAGCSGKPVVLGTARPPSFRFEPPRLLAELGEGGNPTLTHDLLQIYFTSERPDAAGESSGDVWFAERATPSASFSAPVSVMEVNGPSYETSSAIAADGLALWLGSDRDAAAGSEDLEIWVSTRANRGAAWSAPRRDAALNSTARDVPRPPGQKGLIMPLSSERDSPDLYQTYFAARASVNEPFAAPTPLPALTVAGRSVVDAFLSEDGLALFYASGGPGEVQDLFVAFRHSTSEPFEVTDPLGDLNTSADERDPWLSPDATTFFFTSDRNGTMSIYESKVRPR